MRWFVLAGGLLLAVIGAGLAFALQPGRAVNWTALGLIVLIAGVATLLSWGAVHLSSAAKSILPGRPHQTAGHQLAEEGPGARPPPRDRGLSGLLAVVSGILAVVIIGVVTLALLRGGADNSSTVAIATSAFGVISAVVGAYLGVKIGAEQGQAATEAAGAQTQEVTKVAREATAQAKAAGVQTQEVAEVARQATAQAKAAGDQTEKVAEVAEVAREAKAEAEAATQAAGAQTERVAEVAREAKAATEVAREAIEDP